VSDGKARQLTLGGSDSERAGRRTARSLSFLSSRDGTPQVYTVAGGRGHTSQVTSLSGGRIMNYVTRRENGSRSRRAFNPDCKDEACNAARDAAKDKSKVKAPRVREASVPALELVVGWQAPATYSSWQPAAGRRTTSQTRCGLRRASVQPGWRRSNRLFARQLGALFHCKHRQR